MADKVVCRQTGHLDRRIRKVLSPDKGKPKLFGERNRDFRFRHQPQPHQNATDEVAHFTLRRKRLVKIALSDASVTYQQLTQQRTRAHLVHEYLLQRENCAHRERASVSHEI